MEFNEEEGLNVWAKINDCRPWPARIIKKRKPTTQHTGIPVNFFGETEEFSWIEEGNILAIDPTNLCEFSRDCTLDNGFTIAIQQAFIEHCYPCPSRHCKKSFFDRALLQKHLDTYHENVPFSERHIMYVRAQFLHASHHNVQCARHSHFPSCFDNTFYFPALSEPCAIALQDIFDRAPRPMPIYLEPSELNIEGDEEEEEDEDEEEKRKNADKSDEPPAPPPRPLPPPPAPVYLKASSDVKPGEDAYSKNKIRVGGEYQAGASQIPAVISPWPEYTEPDDDKKHGIKRKRGAGEGGAGHAGAGASPKHAAEGDREEDVVNSAQPPHIHGTERAVWKPVPDLEELEALDDYLNFARTRGIRGRGGEKWTNSDVEYAHHLLYRSHETRSTRSVKEKPVITRALMDLTGPERHAIRDELVGYHYQGTTIWNTKEKDAFKRAYEEYGKNFGVIQALVVSKTLRDVIEFYYQEFKGDPHYPLIKARIKERERQEWERAQVEGIVSECDNCAVKTTPRWREGPNKEDWCDACFWHHKRTGKPPKAPVKWTAPTIAALGPSAVIGPKAASAAATQPALAAQPTAPAAGASRKSAPSGGSKKKPSGGAAVNASSTSSAAAAGATGASAASAAKKAKEKKEESAGGEEGKEEKDAKYQCDICLKTFTLQNSLYGHMRVHNEPGTSPTAPKKSGGSKKAKPASNPPAPQSSPPQ